MAESQVTNHEISPDALLAYWEVKQHGLDPSLVDDVDLALVERHLAQCAECAEELRQWARWEPFLRQRIRPVEDIPAHVEANLSRIVKQTLQQSRQSVAVATLAIAQTLKQHQRALQVLGLTGAVFASLDLRRRVRRVREAPADESETTLGERNELEVDPIVFDQFILALDVKPIGERFYLRMSLHDRQEPERVVENCDVTWLVDDQSRHSTATDEDGVAEFLGVNPGDHTFTFSLFPNSVLHIQLASQ